MQSRGRPPVGYEDRGSGHPVVLLHPFPLDRRTWSRTQASTGLTSALAARHRVIAVDARGFGESPPSGPFTIGDLADDVATLLGELEIERATLVGISMGGYAALAFAARHPQRLEALVLADTRAAADTDEARAGREAALRTLRTAGPDAYLTASLPRLLAPNAPADIVAQVRAQAETRADSLLAGIAALRDRPDRSGELPAIRCPTLVVCGEAEQVVPVPEMRAMADAIPGAAFVSIPDAGHLTHIEAPEAFERAVSAFLIDRSGAEARRA